MNDSRMPDKSDRIATYFSAAMVAAVAATFVWLAIQRVREVAAGGAIPVEVPVDEEAVSLPVGPGGAMEEAAATTAIVGVEDPASATLFALYAQPIWMAVAVCAGLAIALAFFRRLARGRAFDKGTAALAWGGATVLTAGWFVGGILTDMTTNGALSAISDGSYEALTFETDIFPVVATLMVGAVAVALQIGEKLQRESEGLV
ncbi:hypothetical protein [Demequina sp.]|uniref:hypothetical protein n=1 Tax=Demequina sp. TaxID=2050685 RepID=UPI003A884042